MKWHKFHITTIKSLHTFFAIKIKTISLTFKVTIGLIFKV